MELINDLIKYIDSETDMDSDYKEEITNRLDLIKKDIIKDLNNLDYSLQIDIGFGYLDNLIEKYAD